jgi:hypothetical protein
VFPEEKQVTSLDEFVARNDFHLRLKIMTNKFENVHITLPDGTNDYEFNWSESNGIKLQTAAAYWLCRIGLLFVAMVFTPNI